MGKKKPANYHGYVIIDKPKNMTSHDVVAKVRRKLNQRQVGHCGTLDPMATGVLVVVVGEGTKLARYLTDDDKAYRATLKLGTSTNTLDAEGQIDQEQSPPDNLKDAEIIRKANEFIGDILQVPPQFSAIKVEGKRAHAAARQGERMNLAARSVTLKSFHLHSYDNVSIDFSIETGKGFYVRSFGRDLAQKLKTLGHLTRLRRTQAGPFDESETCQLDELLHCDEVGSCIKTIQSLPWPQLVVDEDSREDLMQGRSITCEHTDHAPVIALSSKGTPLALVHCEDGRARVLRGFRFH